MEQNKRSEIGKKAGFLGLFFNLILSASKIWAGLAFASVSILADGLNNFSDAAASVITLFGFYFSEKPADKEHPYGHARFEYLSALSVAALILFIGLEAGKGALQKILSPAPLSVNALTVGVLILSVLVKFAMMLIYSVSGKKISSPVLMAAAVDSRNDVIATAAVLLGMVIEHFIRVALDGFVGIALSAFILFSGFKVAKETVSPLLGEGGDESVRAALKQIVHAEEKVIGLHDLMVHDYGPEKCFASVHVEMDQNMSSLEAHECVDRIERACLERLGVSLVVHLDPVCAFDPEVQRLRRLTGAILKMKDERILLHDFRVKQKQDEIALSFDMVLPAELMSEKEKILQSLTIALQDSENKNFSLSVTADLL